MKIFFVKCRSKIDRRVTNENIQNYVTGINDRINYIRMRLDISLWHTFIHWTFVVCWTFFAVNWYIHERLADLKKYLWSVAYFLHFLHVLAQFFCTFLLFLHLFFCFLQFLLLSLQGLLPPDPLDLHRLQVTGHFLCTLFDLHLFFLHELHFFFLEHVSLQGEARCKSKYINW